MVSKTKNLKNLKFYIFRKRKKVEVRKGTGSTQSTN